MALAAARQYTDDLEELSPEEKVELKRTIDDLSSDTPFTTLAVSRFKRIIDKIGPVAGDFLQKLVVNVATEAAKKAMGL